MAATTSDTAPTRARTEPPTRAGRPPAHPLLLIISGYLAGSVWFFRRVLSDLGGSTTSWLTSDAHLFVWWLHWTPWSLLNGGNPLFTTYQHAPFGVNAMWNTTVPLLGVLFAPVTLTAGPVAAYNTAMILGPVVSGVALVVASGWLVPRWWPRAVAGALYGASPFVVAHASVGHLNLVWAVLPPVLLWAVRRVFVDPSPRPGRVGALLGVAFAVQAGLYTQTVALAAVVLLVTAAVLAVRWPGVVVARARGAVLAAVSCVSVFTVLCAYPLYQLLFGQARPRGLIRDPGDTGADAANLLIPSELTSARMGTAGLPERLLGHPGEQGGYLGVAMLVLLAATLLLVRRPAVRMVAAVGVVLLVLSWGSHLVVLGADTGMPLPWRLVQAVPLLEQAEAVRLQVFVALCVALLVALLLNHAAVAPRRWQRWAGAPAALLAAATWLPSDVQQAAPASAPAFFPAAAQHLRPGEVVETVPRISGAWVGGAEPLLWQVSSGMAYRTTGGYLIGSRPGEDVVLEGPVGAYQRAAADVASGLPVTARRTAEARADLARHGVTAVVVVDEAGAAAVAEWTARVVDAPGERIADVWLFRLPA